MTIFTKTTVSLCFLENVETLCDIYDKVQVSCNFLETLARYVFNTLHAKFNGKNVHFMKIIPRTTTQNTGLFALLLTRLQS